MSPKERARKLTPAQRRAEEALNQIAKSSSQPTKRVLDFLLDGTHQPPAPVPDQTQPRPLPNQTQTKPRPKGPIAPERDYNKRANSLERVALPAGVFPGASKKLYDALYVRTRGAVTPTRTIQATRRELMQWSGIKNIKTVNVHIRRLSGCGLLSHIKSTGDHEGSVYELFLPEEANPDQTQTRAKPGPSQKLDSDQDQKMAWVGSGNPTESKGGSAQPKTSIKTTTNDDEAFTKMNGLLSRATYHLTLKNPTPAEQDAWAEVAKVIVEELEVAANRAGSVSSVPAFLAEHLRRRLARRPLRQREEKPEPIVVSPRQPELDPDRRLTPEEITSYAATVADLLKDGATLEEVTAQFAGSLHPEDWTPIRETATALVEQKGG